MLTRTFVPLLVTLGLCLSGCKKNDDPAETKAKTSPEKTAAKKPAGPPKMTAYDVKLEGAELTLQAPEGLSVTEIGGTIKIGGNGYDLRFGKTVVSEKFGLKSQKTIVTPKKESIKFLKDEADGFVAEYEGFGGAKKYKMALLIKVDDKFFVATAHDKDQKKVEEMMAWAKTAKKK